MPELDLTGGRHYPESVGSFNRLGAVLHAAVGTLGSLELAPGFAGMRRLGRRIQAAWAFAGGAQRLPDFPAYLTLEMTNHCNLACVMCPRAKQERPEGMLSMDLLERILDQAEGRLEIIDFDLYGELLLHPRFDGLIAAAKKRGVRTSVNTNATLLSEENCRRLIASGLDFIVLSVDSADAAVYQKIRVGADAAAMREGVERFLAMNAGKIFTVIQKIHMRDNREEIWDYLREFRRSGADFVRLKPYYDLDPAMKELRVGAAPASGAEPCPFPWKLMTVTYDGKVVPCCFDYDEKHVLGDLNREKVGDVWNGPRYSELRRLHAAGRRDEIELCRGCTAYPVGKATMLAGALFDGLNTRKLLIAKETSAILWREWMKNPL